MNPLGNAKSAMAERMMGQITPSETPIGQALANAVAGIEHEQAKAIQEAIEAGDLDVQHGHDMGARRETLLEIADAVAENGFEDWWWTNVAPEILDKPEKARQYVGINGDEWRNLLERWYTAYHANGVVDAPLDEADPGRLAWVADRHIRETFGVNLREFVALVVNWSRGEQMQRALAGQFQSHTQIIHRLADELERKEQRIEDLQNQLQEARNRR